MSGTPIAAILVAGNASRLEGVGRILRTEGLRLVDPALPARQEVAELCRAAQRDWIPDWWEVDPDLVGDLPLLTDEVRATYSSRLEAALLRLSVEIDGAGPAPAALAVNLFPPVAPLLLEVLPDARVLVVVDDPARTARFLLRQMQLSPLHALAIWERQARQLLLLAERHGGRVLGPSIVPAGTRARSEAPEAADPADPFPPVDIDALLTPQQASLLARMPDGRPHRSTDADADDARRTVLALEQALFRARRTARWAEARDAEKDLRALRGHIELLEESVRRLEDRARLQEDAPDGWLVRVARALTRSRTGQDSAGRREHLPALDPGTDRRSPSAASLALPGPAPHPIELPQRLMLAGSWLDAADRWRSLLERPDWTGERAGLPRAGAAVCDWVVHGPPAAAGRAAPRWRRWTRGRVRAKGVVYSAVTRGVDGSWWPGHRPVGFDHVRFTDDELEPMGVFDIRPLPYRGADPRRSARWVKTHPHVLFPDRRWAVWMDGNVLAVEDWADLLEAFMASGAPIGLIRHPERDTVEEEVAACIRLRKERPEVLEEQASRCGPDPGVGLFETGLLMLDLEHPQTIPLLDRWWSLIDGGSTRDQISLPFALRDCGVTPHVLMEHPVSVRTHSSFVLVPHEGPAWSAARSALAQRCAARADAPAASTSDRQGSWFAVRDTLLDARREGSVDIVIPVHDALAEARSCLRTVLATRDVTRHRIIVVDDGSGSQVAGYLDRTAAARPNLILIRNEEALGFCRAANRGLRLSDAETVIVLNSDTRVAGDWILKLADALHRPQGIGIVGPLSNAAGVQSWPRFEADHVERGTDQSPVNSLPSGMTVEDVDALFERSAPLDPVRTSSVHGFCFAMRAEVLDTVGLFDEEAFPEGFGEEVDYCIRAVDAGWGLAWATNTFVWHAKTASYEPARRTELVRRSRDEVIRKHGARRLENLVASSLATREGLGIPADAEGLLRG